MLRQLFKNVRHHGLLTAKNLKITPAKIFKNCNKILNLDEKINNPKLLIQSCLSINFRFSGSFSKPTKTSNKDHSFYKTVLLKKRHFTNLNSLNVKKIYSCNTTKNLTNFRKPVSGWCQMNHLNCTISRQPKSAYSKHLESKCLYIPVNLLKKIFVPET